MSAPAPGPLTLTLPAAVPTGLNPITEGEALLRAIREEPGEDAHRLVYADWLEEHGGEEGPARAELIRFQCRLARLAPGDPERGELERRERRLLKEHRSRWLADVPTHLRGRV